MATNYYGVMRTNYFHVKDEDAFRALMARVYCTEEEIHVFEETRKDGKKVFGFGTFGSICGLRNSDEDDEEEGENYDNFIEALQEVIADDDAVILVEGGHEKLRYVVGAAEVITSKDYSTLDIKQLAVQRAGKMLGNENYTTQCDY